MKKIFLWGNLGVLSGGSQSCSTFQPYTFPLDVLTTPLFSAFACSCLAFLKTWVSKSAAQLSILSSLPKLSALQTQHLKYGMLPAPPAPRSRHGPLAPPSSSGRVRCLLGEVSVNLGQRKGGGRQGWVCLSACAVSGLRQEDWICVFPVSPLWLYPCQPLARLSQQAGQGQKNFQFHSKGYITLG